MRVKTNVILHERFEVFSVLPHVVDDVSPVQEVVVGVPLQLVAQCPEQTIAVPSDLLESQAQDAKLVVEAGEIIEIVCHVLLLLLVSSVGRPDLSLNPLFGHFPTFLKIRTGDLSE